MIFKYFKQFFEYFEEEKKPFFIYSIFSVIAGGLELLGVALIYPFILKILSDNSLTHQKFSSLAIGIVIIALFLVKNLFMILFTYIQTRYTSNFEVKAKKRVLRYILGADYQETSKISLAQKNKIINFLIPNTMNNFVFRLLNLNVNFFIFILIAGCLAVKFPVATISSVLFGVIFLWVQNKIYTPYLKKLAVKISESNLAFNQATNEALLNLKSVKISNNEKYFYDNYNETMSKFYKNAYRNAFVNSIPPYVTEPFAILLLFIMVAIIAYQNFMSPEKLVASLALVGAAIFRLTPAISRIQVNLNGINSALPLVKEFIDIYESCNIKNIKDIKEKDFAEFKNNIELKNICFGYENDKEVIKNISLVIKKGEFIGIAGLSGVGKTTIADIIAGLYKPISGEIYIDGKIQTKPLKIGYVPQEFNMISGDIRKNVAFGNSVIDDKRVEEALKKAQLLEYIEDVYSKGIYANPFVDSQGLSQGQKQRLAIARALYSEPDILIFDEATSSLDLKTEDEICSVLSELKGDKTIIVIAHRLSTIKFADKIVYMEEGKIADIGIFEELVNKSSVFAQMILKNKGMV